MFPRGCRSIADVSGSSAVLVTSEWREAHPRWEDNIKKQLSKTLTTTQLKEWNVKICSTTLSAFNMNAGRETDTIWRTCTYPQGWVMLRFPHSVARLSTIRAGPAPFPFSPFVLHALPISSPSLDHSNYTWQHPVSPWIWDSRFLAHTELQSSYSLV
jgi:hypothetical protein